MARPVQINALLGGTCLLLLLWAAPAHALGTISSVEPKSIRQGDTVMLSIRGDNLPGGSPVVEFYPQQIAVLSLLSTSATEIIAQIKVPNLAAPGLYNVLVYNQAGEEAFAKAMLTVESNVLTPVFRDYDPKVIAQADAGFAIMMHCDAVSTESIAHLSMLWETGGERVSGLRSSFTSLDTSTVVCAVTGKPPGGVLRGTVKLDDKPVYLVEITVMADSGTIVGHAPATLTLAQPPYAFKLLGTDITPNFAGRLRVMLEINGQRIEATRVVLRDKASIAVEFEQQLPLGSTVILVLDDSVEVYQGLLEITDALPPPPPPRERELPEIDTTQLTSGQLIHEEEQVLQPADPASPGQLLPPAPPEGRGGPLPVSAVAPSSFVEGESSHKYTIEFAGAGEGIVSRLQPSLLIDGEAATVLLTGAAGSSLTCIFAAPERAQAAANCTLQIADPTGEFDTYTMQLPVTGGELVEGTVAPPQLPPIAPQLPANLQVKLLLASNKIEIDDMGFRIQLLGAEELPAEALEALEMHADLLLLERNLDKFRLEIIPPQDVGDPVTTLDFRRDAQKLGDELYSLFVEQLRGEGELQLTLSWPSLGATIIEAATFVSSEELVLADMMEGL